MALYNNVSPLTHQPHPLPAHPLPAPSVDSLQGTRSHDITLTFSLIGEATGYSTHDMRPLPPHPCRGVPSPHTHAEGSPPPTPMQRGPLPPHTCRGVPSHHTHAEGSPLPTPMQRGPLPPSHAEGSPPTCSVGRVWLIIVEAPCYGLQRIAELIVSSFVCS